MRTCTTWSLKTWIIVSSYHIHCRAKYAYVRIRCLDLTAPIYYDQSHSNFAPSGDSGEKSDFDDLKLSPLIPKAAAEPDHQVNLTIDFQVTTDGINRGFFNDLPYLAPKVPSINTLFSEGQDALSSTVYGPQSRAIVLDHLDMVEVVLNNLDAGDHPCKLQAEPNHHIHQAYRKRVLQVHLHGHVFQIVARGDGVFDGNRSNVEWHLDNPAQRDTVQVPAESYTIIRFRADNPGVWVCQKTHP